MAARKLYFESVHVGDELPALAKAPVERVQLVRYAGASGDFNPVHIDEVYARGLGMPSVYAPGMLVMGFLSQLVSDWARGAQLRRYSVRFIKMVWPGDTVVCKGRITDRSGEEGRYFAEIELWAENQRGELVMKGQSQIQLFYSLDDENRQRAGQSPLIVNVPRQSLLTATPVAEEAPAKHSPPPRRKTLAARRAEVHHKALRKKAPAKRPKPKPKKAKKRR
jgi:acyl dehydratase